MVSAGLEWDFVCTSARISPSCNRFDPIQRCDTSQAPVCTTHWIRSSGYSGILGLHFVRYGGLRPGGRNASLNHRICAEECADRSRCWPTREAAGMAEQNGTHLVRGMAAGIAGGLVASWVMNIFIEGAGPKITHAVESMNGEKRDQARDEQHDQAAHDQDPKEDATMKAADAIVSTVT